jgi:hypothetical protein
MTDTNFTLSKLKNKPFAIVVLKETEHSCLEQHNLLMSIEKEPEKLIYIHNPHQSGAKIFSEHIGHKRIFRFIDLQIPSGRGTN